MRNVLAMAVIALAGAGGVVAARSSSPPAPAAHPSDKEVADWFTFRQSKFAELKAANADQPAQIAAIKARAAAAIAAAGPPVASVDAPPVIWPTGRAAPLVVFDDPAAPRMVVVPAGEFTMGSPSAEPGRAVDEGPRRRVRIGYPLAVSMFPIVYGEYALFAAGTHRPANGPCRAIADGKPVTRAGLNWRDAGYAQTVRHPVTCVSHDDAVAYAAWLSRRTGHPYRLLSEAEYEYVERAGTPSAYWWGADADAACAYANGLDQDGKAANLAVKPIACRDGYAFTAPAGSFKPNPFGLFDTAGNVSSWTADCWTGGYASAPADGAPAAKGSCRLRVIRGGSWANTSLRSASRDKRRTSDAGTDLGFRVARVL